MAIVESTNAMRAKFKKAMFLFFEGFREACCLHRVVFFCLRSKMLSIRTGQCFLLNGFIFLGSISILNSVIIPTLQWILPDKCQHFGSQDPCSFGGIAKFYSILHLGLVQLFYMLWFYPLYLFSFVLSNIWYNDMAKYAYVAMGRHGPVAEPSSQKEVVDSQNLAHVDKPAGLGGVIIGIGEQVISVLLLSFFFIEACAVEFIPYVGKGLNFLLLSWMYAYYCFEYKWNLAEVSLEKRLDFFESNWAFFAGFGSPCVLAIFFFSRLVSYGVMAILFPLVYILNLFTFFPGGITDEFGFQFVLTATGSEADQFINCQRRKWIGAGLGRLRIFRAADTLSMRVLSLFHEAPHGRREEKEL